MTPAAAEKWSPDGGVLIYSGSPKVNGNTVTFADRLVGSLNTDRSYAARNDIFRWNFGVTRVNGEWRVNNPPPGLMVAAASFASFYQAYELYFVGNDSSLVPDPIYLPKLRSPANVTSALMKALLSGPSIWLRPAVQTYLPPGTTLSVDSVTIRDGVADVPLSDTILALSDTQRSLMAAQVVYTLKQVVGVKGVLFTVNQQPFRVPESDPTSLAVSVDAILPELDPIPFATAEQLYAVQRQKVELVDGGAGQPTLRPIPGPLGQGAYEVESLAVSVTNTDLAAVTDGGTVLRHSLTSVETPPTVIVTGVKKLLRPQFTRYNELWAVAEQGARQRIWSWVADKRVDVDATSVLAGGEITAFKISPDGTRMALIRNGKDGQKLGLARITRSDTGQITVDGWRSLNTTQGNKPQITRMKDVGWLDATNLLVLGAASNSASLGLVQLNQDASEIVAEPPADNWDAEQLTVLLRTQTALVLGGEGQTYKDDGNRWQPFLSHMKAIAYPG